MRWSKWEHVMFVEDWRAGTPTYEILRRKSETTGLTQYKRVYVGKCVHRLSSLLTEWFKEKLKLGL